MKGIDTDLEKLYKLGKEIYYRRFHLLSAWSRYFTLPRARQAYKSPLLIEYLTARYSQYQLFNYNGLVHPVVVFQDADWPKPLDKMDILNPGLDLNWKPDFLTKFLPYYITNNLPFYWLQRSHVRRSEEDPTFIMKKLDTEPFLNISCGCLLYFSVLKTAYPLEWELMKAIAHAEEVKCYSTLKIAQKLNLRNRLHDSVSDPVKNGEGRANGIGLSMLTAYRDNEDFRLWLRYRGEESISLGRYQLHVIPAGEFQAPIGEYPNEFSISHAALREFWEELFSGKPPEKNTEPNEFYSKEPMIDLMKMLNNGQATIYQTGVAVDLTNLRPELLLCLLIKDPDWYRRNVPYFKTPREYADISELFKQNKPRSYKIPFRKPFSLNQQREDTLRELNIILKPGNIRPPAAACLFAGIKVLEKFVSI